MTQSDLCSIGSSAHRTSRTLSQRAVAAIARPSARCKVAGVTVADNLITPFGAFGFCLLPRLLDQISAIHQDDTSVFSREPMEDGAADTLGGARHYRNFASKAPWIAPVIASSPLSVIFADCCHRAARREFLIVEICRRRSPCGEPGADCVHHRGRPAEIYIHIAAVQVVRLDIRHD